MARAFNSIKQALFGSVVLSLSMLLCSCATFRRVPVVEIEPPPMLASVPIRLPPSFNADCSYRPYYGEPLVLAVEVQKGNTLRPLHVYFLAQQKLLTPLRLDADILRNLHEHQEQAIRSTGTFLEESRLAFDQIAQTWLSAQTALNSDTHVAWRHATEQAYRNIVSRVLDASQRKRHDKLRRRNMSRADLWSRIAVTPSQRLRMQRIYEESLTEAQPAWAVARAFHAQAHGNLDTILPALEAKRSELRLLANAVEAVLADVAEADRKYRDAERQEQWLQAKLEASRDNFEQIRIRKEIADLRTDAELLRINSREQAEMVNALVWRGMNLRDLEAELAQRVEIGHALHAAHIAMLKEVSGWTGRRAAPNDPMYRRFGSMLQDAMRRMVASPNGFSEATVDDIKRRLGGN